MVGAEAGLIGPESSAVLEIWFGEQPASTERIHTANGMVSVRHNGALALGVVTVPVPPVDADAAQFESAVIRAYEAIFEAQTRSGYPYLLRVWNSIPWINAVDQGLERYRRFNVQRYKAFERAQRPTHAGAPAAAALGSFGGPLVVHFLAAPASPVAIENPRQVSAYEYPQQYGPQPPNFSRAALWHATGSEMAVLFISGTASIVGHETKHRHDVVAQTREILVNLKAVLLHAQRQAMGHGIPLIDQTLDALPLKVYFRHPADVPAIRNTLLAEGMRLDRILFVHADICREDLLIEIEAVSPASVLCASLHERSTSLSDQS